MELPIARMLLSLTHHPDCRWDPAGLKEISRLVVHVISLECEADADRFIDLYLDCMMNRDNVGLLYHVASKIKTVRDEDKEYDSDVTGLSCRRNYR